MTSKTENKTTEPEVIEVFVTKWALTKGVFKLRGRVTTEYSHNAQKPNFSVDVPIPRMRGICVPNLLYYGEWWITHAAAAQHVRHLAEVRKKAPVRAGDRLNAIISGIERGELPMVKEAS